MTIATNQSHPSRQHSNQASIGFGSGLSEVTVIIPALNEEQSLPFVLQDLPKVGRVIVVDNGSIDNTARVAADCGADVIHEPVRGYGSACLKGLREVTESVLAGARAPAIVAFVDADYSDHPNLLPQLIKPIQTGTADFVLGSRLQGEREPGAMPPQSIYGNVLACFLMRVFFRKRYTDLGPFRAIDYASLLKLDMVDRNFGWTVEMQIKAARSELRTLEIPVPYRCRIGASKISGTISGTIKAGSKILYLIACYGLFSSSSSTTAAHDTEAK